MTRIIQMAAAALALAAALCAPGTELRVTTEYRYPTRYEIRGGQFVVGPRGQTLVQEAIVVPTDFATREVGVVMSVEAVVSPMGHGSVTIASLEQGNRNGNTELMLAATSGDLEKVRRLLQKGVIVNARNYYGSTALMGAAAGGFDNVVRALLMKGAFPNSKSNTGSTPLMFAARNGHAGVVKLLLQAGAKVNDSDTEGISPLMYGVESGSRGVVQALIEAGAKVEYRDRHGTTPVRLAEAGKYDDILVLLTRSGPRK